MEAEARSEDDEEGGVPLDEKCFRCKAPADVYQRIELEALTDEGHAALVAFLDASNVPKDDPTQRALQAEVGPGAVFEIGYGLCAACTQRHLDAGKQVAANLHREPAR